MKKLLLVSLISIFSLGVDAQEVETDSLSRYEIEGYNDTLENRVVPPYVNRVCPNVRAALWRKVLVTGSGKTIRAFSPFKGVLTTVAEFANIANTYKKTFGDSVNVWLMPIPTAAAFYSPLNNAYSTEEYSTINYLFGLTDSSVHCVDVHTILGMHAEEEIYARTDHHWLPLGAHYAAKRFAALAQVPFFDVNDTTKYEKNVVHRFCGTMYMYSRNINVKNNPEEFYFWKPIDVDYQTDYVKYSFAGPHRVTGQKILENDKFFMEYPDGSVGAYCTFMGGDAKLTHVHTSTNNGRRVLFVKDSFGNAIPSNLFYSFEDLYVVDCRYFTKNLTEFVQDNKITDVVLCNNIQFMGNVKIQAAVMGYLTQNPTR